MIATVPSRDNGTVMPGMIVAGQLRRNTQITATTSTIAISSSICTSWTDARIVSVRSLSICRRTELGRAADRLGSAARMPSTVRITLAPGWRWMLISIAGVSFA